MKNTVLFIQFILLVAFTSCTNGQSKGGKTSFTPAEFSKKLSETPDAQLIDVRTPGEVAGGFIDHAVNIDYNGSDFEGQISKLDKAKPVFVYCLSGGRSGSAASDMRAMGFKEVFELEGGIMQWNNANLPLVTSNSKPKDAGMTSQQFNDLINTDKIVLIDYYAEWCAPCKKMKPYLDEISTEMKDQVVVIRIDVDKNPLIAKEQKIQGIPLLQVYKNKEKTWSNVGLIDKAEVVKQLK
jgi:thioredoxin 1